jgi:hypothetical protein
MARGPSLFGQLLGAATAAVDAQESGVRPFAQLGILADTLAQLGFVALNVEQIVDNLKSQSNRLTISIESLGTGRRRTCDHRTHS